jgi:hypothetical protein
VAGTDPGERPTPDEGRTRRVLDRPPSDRYARAPGAAGATLDDSDGTAPRSALIGPLLRALVVGVAGSGALVLVGAVLASTVGLLFISGAIGAGVGLVLARAAAPTGGARPVARRTVTWLAVLLTLAAIVSAFVATWLFARSEGGVLGLLDYLWTAFGPFVPGELLIGLVAAGWGANAGPVQR